MEHQPFNNFLDESNQLLGFGHIYEDGSQAGSSSKYPGYEAPQNCDNRFRDSGYQGDSQMSLNRGIDTLGQAWEEPAPSLSSRATESSLPDTGQHRNPLDSYFASSMDNNEAHLPQNIPYSNKSDKENFSRMRRSFPYVADMGDSDSIVGSVPGGHPIIVNPDYADDMVASLYDYGNPTPSTREVDTFKRNSEAQLPRESDQFAVRTFQPLPTPYVSKSSLDMPTYDVPQTGGDNNSVSKDTTSFSEKSLSPANLPESATTNRRSDRKRGKKIKRCPICGRALLRDLTRHIRTHQADSGYYCPFPRDQCNHKRGSFNRRYEYKKHLISSHFICVNKQAIRDAPSLLDKLRLGGTCRCGEYFDTIDSWIADHIETRRCPLLQEN